MRWIAIYSSWSIPREQDLTDLFWCKMKVIMSYRTCKLCLQQKDLRQSHYIPSENPSPNRNPTGSLPEFRIRILARARRAGRTARRPACRPVGCSQYGPAPQAVPSNVCGEDHVRIGTDGGISRIELSKAYMESNQNLTGF